MKPVLVDEETRKRRLAICEACPHRLATRVPLSKQTFARCGKCGCPLASKTKFARATCPIHKW